MSAELQGIGTIEGPRSYFKTSALCDSDVPVSLLGRKHSILKAQHTLKLVLQAVKRGDLRLAVSRGITAVIEASSAAVGAPEATVGKAKAIVEAVRKVIQGAVITKMDSLSGPRMRWSVPKRYGEKGYKSIGPLINRPKPAVTAASSGKGLQTRVIPQGIVVYSKSPILLQRLATALGIRDDDGVLATFSVHPDGLIVEGNSARQVVDTLNSVLFNPKTMTGSLVASLLSKRLFG